MVDDFPLCIAFTFAQEGGYSDDPRDPGGATNMGVTLATLSHWSGMECTADDVRALGQDEAKAIYRALYWQACRCDILPTGVNLMVFDFAVNAGLRTSVSELQEEVGAVPDGVIGPKTEAAVAAVDPSALVQRLQAAHEAHYRSLAGFAAFGNGWLSRLRRCAVTAQQLAAPFPN